MHHMKTGERSYSKKGLKHWFQLGIISILIAGIFSVSAFLLWATTLKIPDFSLFETRKVSQSTKIYDRTGTILLYDVHGNIRRTVVPFDAISPYVKNATVAIEDDQFYQHIGIKPEAILRAMWINLRSGGFSQGGSTITQQVIKNSLLSQEKTVTRKIKEWILALKLERAMSKEQILGLYLNETPYGGNIYGVEEASLSFFGVHASDLTLAEAAYLASLPQSPTRLSPYGNNKGLLEDRKNLVLKKMLTLGSITQTEYTNALAEKIKFIPQADQGIRAPHFVMFIKEQLVDTYGEDVVNEGGLRVTTTLDMDMQSKAEDVVNKYAAQNEKTFNAKNAAMVALDPKTGQILAMVGSRDYFDAAHEGNFNVALAKRQPGSSFKAFVYGAAFEKGYTPDTVVFDVPTQFSTRCDTSGNPLPGSDSSMCYMPQNFDQKFRGPMTLRDAIAQSVNVPAVKVLYLTGIDRVLDFAERMGITTLGDKSQYGLTLALGAAEVTLLDMTSAYGTFANDGVRNPYTGILRVENPDGSVLAEYTPTESKVIDPNVARQISSVLSDNAAREPEFGSDSALNIPNRDVAVKTGTTNDYRDAWIIGYTPSIAVGAWAGNNDNTPMEKKIAGFIIAPLWNAFMSEILPTLPDEKFPEPQPTPKTAKPALRGIWYGGETYAVDKISGKRATAFTPSDLIDERVVPNPHEILYWVNKDDPTGPPPTNPYNDPQFLLWETPAQAWIATNGLPAKAWGKIPEEFDDIHTPEHLPVITIVEPNATTTYTRSQKLFVNTTITSSFPIKHVDFFVNGTFLGSVPTLPYTFAFVPGDLDNTQAQNELRVVTYDAVGNRSEQTVLFSVDNN